MSEFIKGDKTSWEVLSPTVAIKSTDLSSLKYNEIRVTNEVKNYFELEHMEKHERRDIYLHYSGVEYPCVIYLDSYDKGRGKLRWGKKFKKVFSDLISGYFFESEAGVNPPLLRFRKIDKLNYELCFIFVKEIIENTMEVDDRDLPFNELYRLYENNFIWKIETLKYHGSSCAICGFDYVEEYGDAGKGRCQVHIIPEVPSSEYRPEVSKDLIPVCANCHDMLHAGYSKDDLLSMVTLRKGMKSLIK